MTAEVRSSGEPIGTCTLTESVDNPHEGESVFDVSMQFKTPANLITAVEYSLDDHYCYFGRVVGAGASGSKSTSCSIKKSKWTSITSLRCLAIYCEQDKTTEQECNRVLRKR
jgi:hypothetical protein